MEAIRIPLPADETDTLRIVRVWGERRLQGFADTGVFSIATDCQQTAGDESKTKRTERRAEEDLDFTVIEFDGSLSVTSTEDGDDPYNRYVGSGRTSSL